VVSGGTPAYDDEVVCHSDSLSISPPPAGA
jgi:hypothetical protein